MREFIPKVAGVLHVEKDAMHVFDFDCKAAELDILSLSRHNAGGAPPVGAFLSNHELNHLN